MRFVGWKAAIFRWSLLAASVFLPRWPLQIWIVAASLTPSQPCRIRDATIIPRWSPWRTIMPTQSEHLSDSSTSRNGTLGHASKKWQVGINSQKKRGLTVGLLVPTEVQVTQLSFDFPCSPPSAERPWHHHGSVEPSLLHKPERTSSKKCRVGTTSNKRHKATDANRRG